MATLIYIHYYATSLLVELGQKPESVMGCTPECDTYSQGEHQRPKLALMDETHDQVCVFYK